MQAGLRHLRLGDHVEVHLTSASLPGVTDANLAHHRPHVPAALDAARTEVAARTAIDHRSWHLMRQVHGAAVAVMDGAASGTEARGVDALVTTEVERPLVVLSADCMPIVIAGARAIAVVHAGWRGVVADVIGRTLEVLIETGEDPSGLRALVGPSIGPCCYAVGTEVRDAIGTSAPGALARTLDGLPAVDLVEAARVRLAARGVGLSDEYWECTACGPGDWFSHRRDPRAGRQATIALRRAVVPS